MSRSASDQNVEQPPEYDSCIEVCGNLDSPGLGVDDGIVSDFSQRSTTPDQRAIEAELAKMIAGGMKILHVGIGNSGLAERFAHQVRCIIGVTVSPDEKKAAESMRIGNYSVHLVNKYSRDLATRIMEEFDVIVDNNLTSYACCKYHVFSMMESYRNLLSPNGKILTDQRGMAWVYEKGDQHWAMTFDDLSELGRRFGLRAHKITDMVYALALAK